MHIHVVAAVLEDEGGRVLLTKRPEHVHQGGLWEFPGGKLESGESPGEGLARELNEELGLDTLTHRPLIRVVHDYGDRHVLLDVYRMLSYAGEPRGLEGQPIAWVSPNDLGNYAMPAADHPVITAIRLPDRYLITPSSADDPVSFLNAMAVALAQDVRLIQLRVFRLPRDDYVMLAREAVELCHDHGARLIVSSDLSVAREIGADGVHLSARQLYTLNSRPTQFSFTCASCHNAVELLRAQELGLDFVVLSPVLPTLSHPHAQPLGWQRFALMVNNASLPVYALGGMDASLLETAWQAGAQGVAGIRGFWPHKDLIER